MKTIWKTPLLLQGEQDISLPDGAQHLTVQNQYDYPVLWSIVETTNKGRSYKIRMTGTGHEIDFAWSRYIGTVQLVGGGLVWHFFEA